MPVKRILSSLIALVLCLSLAACGSVSAPGGGEEQAHDQPTSQLTSPTGSAPSEEDTAEEDTQYIGDKEEPEDEAEEKPAEDTENADETDPQPEDSGETEEAPGRTIDPKRPMVALTFDDGPHKTLTPMLLDILEENGAVATFFEVGRNVWKAPEALVRMEELGCEIGSHSNAHKDLSKLSKAALLKDLHDSDAAFIAAVGHAPYLLRPPYGAVNDAVKHETGRAVVTWDIDTVDWKTKDPQVVCRFMDKAEDLDGKIVLLHSTHASTVEAMRTVIPQLIERGYQLVTVTELFAYHYGEVPQQDHFYGYTYFHKHGKTDTPAELPETYPVPADPLAEPIPEKKPEPEKKPVEKPEAKPSAPKKPAPPEKPVPKPPANNAPANGLQPIEELPSIEGLDPLFEPVLPEEDTAPGGSVLP